MSGIKNIILIGAGGNLGPSVLTAFLSSPFNVTVLSRENSSSTLPSNVKVIRANYDSTDSLKSAFQGQDAVISLVGGSVFGDQNKFIDAAIAAGVQRFLPSEFGSYPNPRFLEIVPVFNGKKTTVDYLKSKEDVISWTSIITGPFFDWGVKVGFLGLDAQSKTATLIDEGKATFSATNLRQVGEAIIKTLQKPAETKNKYVFTFSVVTSQAEILQIAENVTAAKWTVKQVSSKELIDLGNEKIKKQDFGGIGDLIKAGAFGAEELADYSSEGLWNEKLGLQKEDLEESVRAGLAGRLVGEK